MRWRKITIALAAIAAVAVCAWLLSSPSSAAAATPHPIGGGGPLDAIGGLVSGVFSSIGHAVLGAFTWTIEPGQQVHPDHRRRAGEAADPVLLGSQGPADHGLDRPGPQLRREDHLAGRRQPLRVLRDQRAARPVHVARDRDRAADARRTRRRGRCSASANPSRSPCCGCSRSPRRSSSTRTCGRRARRWPIRSRTRS